LSVLKNPRVIIWIAFILIAIMLIGPRFDRSGLQVVNSHETGIQKGDIIKTINGKPATELILNEDYYERVRLETSKGIIVLSPNGTINITTETPDITNLQMGLDLKGGIRAVVSVGVNENTTLQDVISVLQTRINLFGLREASFRPVIQEEQRFVEITLAGGNEQELRELLERTGVFESKISLITSSLTLDKKYDFDIRNDSVIIDGKTAKKGDQIKLADIPFTINSIGAKDVNLTALVFTSDDIEFVFFDPQHSSIKKTDNGYSWEFAVQISNKGAEKFAWVTSNLNSIFDPQSGQNYLSSRIEFYLDGKEVNSLSIASSLKGKQETNPAITGGSATREDAISERKFLQSILRSGSLPVSIEVMEMNTISPKLGMSFLKNLLIAGLLAMIALSIVVIVRYRKLNIIVPMLIISVTETLITLGLSGVIGATIDLAAIAGIIAAIGTGVDDQLVIVDNIRKGREDSWSVKERIKRAFFIIFGAASTVIAAMIPMMILGFGVIRGFAIMTVLGILVGIFITRPAFTVIMEKILEK